MIHDPEEALPFRCAAQLLKSGFALTTKLMSVTAIFRQ
jgi:hypothetical protein